MGLGLGSGGHRIVPILYLGQALLPVLKFVWDATRKCQSIPFCSWDGSPFLRPRGSGHGWLKAWALVLQKNLKTGKAEPWAVLPVG